MKLKKRATTTTTKNSLFLTGEEAERAMEERTAQREAEAEERRKNAMPRFWLEVGSTAKLLFISPKPVLVSEHNLKLNGRWGNFYLCRKTLDQCPLCDAGDRSYDALLYTVINLTGYVSSQTGKRIKNIKQVLALKSTAAAKFKRKKKDLETVKFAIFEFARDSKDDPATGGDITFVKQLDLKEVIAYFRKAGMKDEEIKELLTPYNFEEKYQLKSIAELEALVGTKTVKSIEDDDNDNVDLDVSIEDDDVDISDALQEIDSAKSSKASAAIRKVDDTDDELSDDDTSLLDELQA